MGSALPIFFNRLKESPRLQDFEGGRSNNLNLIRFFLATAVVFSHCYLILDDFHDEPMKVLFPNRDLGGTAVVCFFFLSGYLIFKSALRASPDQFVLARILRLFPALAVVTIACAFLLGPSTTTLRIADYLTDQTTWRYLGTLVLQLGDMQLPGVFGGDTVNQPLWTLGSEWLMYSVMLLVSVVTTARSGHLTGRGTIFVLLALLFSVTLIPITPWSHFWNWLAFSACGAAAYACRRWIPLSLPLLFLLVAAELVASAIAYPVGKVLFIPTLFYALLVIGFHPKLHVSWQHKIGDYSYGIYILGWPFQQLVKPFSASPLMMFTYAFPLTLMAAIASWHFIERPSLRHKSRRSNQIPDGVGLRQSPL